jgi:hypothetical protein
MALSGGPFENAFSDSSSSINDHDSDSDSDAEDPPPQKVGELHERWVAELSRAAELSRSSAACTSAAGTSWSEPSLENSSSPDGEILAGVRASFGAGVNTGTGGTRWWEDKPASTASAAASAAADLPIGLRVARPRSRFDAADPLAQWAHPEDEQLTPVPEAALSLLMRSLAGPRLSSSGSVRLWTAIGCYHGFCGGYAAGVFIANFNDPGEYLWVGRAAVPVWGGIGILAGEATVRSHNRARLVHSADAIMSHLSRWRWAGRCSMWVRTVPYRGVSRAPVRYASMSYLSNALAQSCSLYLLYGWHNHVFFRAPVVCRKWEAPRDLRSLIRSARPLASQLPVSLGTLSAKPCLIYRQHSCLFLCAAPGPSNFTYMVTVLRLPVSRRVADQIARDICKWKFTVLIFIAGIPRNGPSFPSKNCGNYP